MQVQLEKLKSLVKGLTELQESSERHRRICFFDSYYSNYEKYKTSYLEAGKLLKEEVVENLELEIPKLPTGEIAALIKKGEDNAVLGGYLSDISEYSKKLASNIQNVVVLCENAAKADAYLNDAHHEKDRAGLLLTKSDWAGSVEASQQSIGHSIKSLFALSGVPHSFARDPTKKFRHVAERLNLQNCEVKDLARIRWLAKIWATIDEESWIAFRDIPAREFFNEKDAKILLDYANEVYLMCIKLVDKVRVSQLKT